MSKSSTKNGRKITGVMMYSVMAQNYEYNDEIEQVREGGQITKLFKTKEKANEFYMAQMREWLEENLLGRYGYNSEEVIDKDWRKKTFTDTDLSKTAEVLEEEQWGDPYEMEEKETRKLVSSMDDETLLRYIGCLEFSIPFFIQEVEVEE